MSEEIHGRHLEHLSDIIAGRTSPLTELVFDLLKFYGVFQGATSLKGGSDGFVPAPAAGDEVKFLCGDGTWRAIPSGKVILNNIPASVNGGMWYEVEYGMPAVKIYYNGQKYPVGMSRDPGLTVTLTSSATVTAVNPATATVSYEGGGKISIETNPKVELTYKNGTITIPYADVEGAVTVTVRLSSSAGFKGASKSFTVIMQKLPSNLRVTPTATTIPADSYINATVQYDDPKAQITVTSSNSNVITSYTNKKVAVRYASGVTSATITVTLTASAGYTNETKTFTVTMERLSPNLTLNQTEFFTAGKTITIPVTRRGNGEIRVEPVNTNQASAEYSDGVITAPYFGFTTNTQVQFKVTVAANGAYDEMTVYFTVTYSASPVVNLPFENSVTEDLSGGTWEIYESPCICELPEWSQTRHAKCAKFYTEGVHRHVGLKRIAPLSIGGQDFTIRFWFWLESLDCGKWARIFELLYDENDGTAKNSVLFGKNGSYSAQRWLYIDGTETTIQVVKDVWIHYELVYQHDIQTTTCYIDGMKQVAIERELARVPRILRLVAPAWESRILQEGNEQFPYVAGITQGYMDDFRIYDGVALHTSNFDPTEEM